MSRQPNPAKLSSNLFFIYGISCLIAVALKTVMTLILCEQFSSEGVFAAVLFGLLGIMFIRRGYREVYGREEDPPGVS